MKNPTVKLPVGTWVKCKTNGVKRFVTRHTSEECFEDDGTISGQEPSPYCWFKYYETALESEVEHSIS
jgi:hypothetical protein